MSVLPDEFPATQWSLVLSAGSGRADSRQALERLLRAYWSPLLAFLRRDGHDPDTAQDLLQGYLTRLLERHDLARVAPDRGRFRSYLLAGLRNYLVSEARKEFALKRGAGGIVSFESDEAVRQLATIPDPGTPPEVAFDRQWARTVLERALDRLRTEQESGPRPELFEALQPTLTGEDSDDHSAAAGQLGMTPGAVAVAIHRLRRRLRELVRVEVRETVGSAADLEDEMRHLLAVWSS